MQRRGVRKKRRIGALFLFKQLGRTKQFKMPFAVVFIALALLSYLGV